MKSNTEKELKALEIYTNVLMDPYFKKPKLPAIKIDKIISKKKSKAVNLYINLAGDLWIEPKKKYCYPMGQNSDRCKIIRILMKNKDYNTTASISFELDNKSEQSIRTEIAKIRKNMKKFLKIEGGGILESKKGSGYRIGSGYKIELKN